MQCNNWERIIFMVSPRRSLEIHPAFNVVDEDDFILQFSIAKEFFLDNPDETKLHRGNKSAADEQYIDDLEYTRGSMKNSFIKIEGEPNLLMLASVSPIHILGKGTSGRVKFAMDENKQLYVVKVINEVSSPKMQRAQESGSLPIISSIYEDINYINAPSLKKIEDKSQVDMVKEEFFILKDIGSGVGESPLHRKNSKKFYIVEQFLGYTLSKKLSNENLIFIERVKLAIQICLAVHALHNGDLSKSSTCYSHGDLKPENIVIDEYFVSIIDVGSSYRIGSDFRPIMKGTPMYMPLSVEKLLSLDKSLQKITAAAQLVMDKEGPIFCDIVALKRVLSLSLKFNEVCVFRPEDLEKLPIRIREMLSTDNIENMHRGDSALSIGTNLSNFLITLIADNTSAQDFNEKNLPCMSRLSSSTVYASDASHIVNSSSLDGLSSNMNTQVKSNENINNSPENPFKNNID